MAEYVEQSIEEMLGELEEMLRIGIFTDQERSIILKKRKNYEYKLRRKTKCKEDYLQYIQYEINVHGLVKERLQMIRGNEASSKAVQISIVERILNLFKLATTRFKDDEALWLSYIQFTKQQSNNKSQVTRLFTNMLKMLNRNPKLWVMAASWEFETCENPSSARRIMQKGLRFNPESQLLWIEYYKMECILTDKLKQMKETNPERKIDTADAVLDGRVADVILEEALKAFPGDVIFIKQLLLVCDMFDFAQQQQQTILDKLKTDYCTTPEAWNILARRCQHPDHSEKVFRDGITTLPNEEMWSLYLQFCWERMVATTDENEKISIADRLWKLYREAANLGTLSSNFYSLWVNSLREAQKFDDAFSVSTQSVNTFTDDPQLWQQHIQLLITQNQDKDTVLKAFKRARKKVAVNSSMALWRLVLDYLLSINSSHLIPLLEEGSISPEYKLCTAVKEWYIRWYIHSNTPSECRLLYKKLIQTSCTSLLFYYLTLKYELKQLPIKVKRCRSIFEDAVRTYGDSNANLWLYFIAFEYTHGDPVTCGSVYERAVRTLQAIHVDGFINIYTDSKNNSNGFANLISELKECDNYLLVRHNDDTNTESMGI